MVSLEAQSPCSYEATITLCPSESLTETVTRSSIEPDPLDPLRREETHTHNRVQPGEPDFLIAPGLGGRGLLAAKSTGLVYLIIMS